MTTRPTAGNARPSTDRHNDPVVDPTANVLLLIEAAVKRIDDLRAAEIRRTDELRMAESRRVDEEMRLHAHFFTEISSLRAEYNDKLASAEAKRIDAIRAVDVNAVAVASQRAADQASVLANQVAQAAEVARTLVAGTASALSTSQSQSVAGLQSRLTQLEQSAALLQGKSTIGDPANVALSDAVRRLEQAASTSGGERRGMTQSYAILTSAAGLVLTLVTIASVLYAVLHK